MICVKYCIYVFLSKYLAILFFLNNYNGSLPNLPGVENDEKELKKVLKKYKKVVINSSKNILEDVQEIVQANKQKGLERVHFHFSGRILNILSSDWDLGPRT